jgi:SAM-dependent methyltransferase
MDSSKDITVGYIDHFGEQSKNYLHFRPNYPHELYVYLASLVNEHMLAWDAGTGNGQAAIQLAEYFDEVIATDINRAQIDAAFLKDNVCYEVCPSEKTDLKDSSVDLITVAQALHWFDLDRFYQEVRRVAKPQGIFAAWAYSLGSINDEVDHQIKKLYEEILGENYWAKERKWIDQKYQTIPFPFTTIETPDFIIEKELNFNELIGYLNTWSGVKEYKKQNEKDPIKFIHQDLSDAWGSLTIVRTMTWPIHLLVGHVHQL